LKAKIVAESYADDALPVAEIARRYGARGSQVHGWRKDAREGRLVLPANTGKLNFAPIVVAEPKAPPSGKPPAPDASTIEIESSGVSVRIRGAVEVKMVEAIVRTLRA
jgi:transposase